MAASWVEGGSGGDVNFGGSITVPGNVTWMWLLGDGKTDFANQSSEMTDSGKKLVITAANDIPILAGKLKTGVKGSDLVPTGTMPQIDFLSGGSKITPVFSNSGGLSLTVKLLDKTSSAELGTLKINGRSAGVVAMKTAAGQYEVKSLGSSNNDIFVGGVSPTGSQLIWGGGSATAVVEKFGGPTLAEVEQMVKDYVSDPSAVFSDINQDWGISRNDSTDMSMPAYGISYGFGVEQGSTLEATFTNPVTSTTEW
ncbi:hypothetical protein QFM21_004770, partial [Escherichia coli]|nr:hypothetical protein [Escherichia coli]